VQKGDLATVKLIWEQRRARSRCEGETIKKKGQSWVQGRILSRKGKGDLEGGYNAEQTV